MTVYRWVWRAGTGCAFVLSLMAGLIVLPAAVWIMLASLAVPFGLMLAIGTAASDGLRGRRLSVVKVTVTGYLAVVACVVLLKLLGPAALVVLVLALATSPRAIDWYGRRLARGRDEPMPQATVTTGQLCREWLDSYQALNDAPTAAARLRVVMARQRCLDELERRDPAGLQAWLSSSASAGGDPHRFLTDSGG